MREKLHALIRAKERLNLTLTHTQLKAMSKRVREGRFLCSQKQGREVWRINTDVGEVDVVYDTEHEHIVTFLPLKTVGKAGTKKDKSGIGVLSAGANVEAPKGSSQG